jgi:hypothetical protein
MSSKEKVCRGLAVAMVVSGLAAPAAPAATDGPNAPLSQGPYEPLPVPTHADGPSAQAGGGFDWGDAGIGAGAMFGLTGIAAGSALAVGRRRRPV